MEIYLVGGAVRDKLLGLPVREKDWVVVGSTPDELGALGFKSVGKDFPVYLHPETGEEYALARTERKSGKGHRGFECDSSTSVTLEDDLKRRDFTINAIAEDGEGRLIDPWGGIADLRHRVLRHVSPAFEEDPLRVVRAARFCAKLHRFGFELHPDTRSIIHTMVSRGDLEELPPERIFAEVEKALATDHPEIFFEQLQTVGAHDVLWPEVTGAGIALLGKVAAVSADAVTRFASLVADLEPAQTDRLCRRLKTPSKYREPAVLLCRYYEKWKNVLQMEPEEIAEVLHGTDAFRREDRFSLVSDVCRMIDVANGEAMAQRKHENWLRYRNLADSVRAQDIKGDVRGRALGRAIREKQIELIEQHRDHD